MPCSDRFMWPVLCFGAKYRGFEPKKVGKTCAPCSWLGGWEAEEIRQSPPVKTATHMRLETARPTL